MRVRFVPQLESLILPEPVEAKKGCGHCVAVPRRSRAGSGL